ncbi:hypothetical protein HPC62_03560 [Thermoleptolyngbya sichuanensis A183]|uniref:Uncharacterized protein n=1 Tax=Thermoleptolyngbya sichuanensis A183 TaxID=2737172 RepID=A0A6M8BBB2_9CYAN|nr:MULTISPECIES: hypothetical protein [Thermoleptolyngbya]QKD81376.1 hypothetical protein HPC62_03560 [Thermoleptolyngbya sichuanensis A183]
MKTVPFATNAEVWLPAYQVYKHAADAARSQPAKTPQAVQKPKTYRTGAVGQFLAGCARKKLSKTQSAYRKCIGPDLKSKIQMPR